MTKLKLYICCLIGFLFSTLSSYGQIDSCITKLQTADQKFNDGFFDDAILILNGVIGNCNLSKADEITSRKLLILAYLDIDELEQAEESASKIMKLNPNYLPDKLRDRADYISIFSKYKPTPVFSLGAHVGTNSSQLTTIKTYSILYDNDTPGLANYQSQLGFQVGVNAQQRVYKSFWIELGAQFRSSTYLNTLFYIENSTVNYSEKISYFDFPIQAKYYFLTNRFKPFVYGGLQASVLNSALGELTRDEFIDIVNRKVQRNSFSVGYFGGFGISYMFKSLNFELGSRYVYYPDQLNKAGTRYENLSSVFKYYYIDNDFRMDLFELVFSVKYSIKYKNL